MKVTFKNKKISSILAILPEKELYFDDEIINYGFTKEKAKKYKKLLGLNKHRHAKASSAVSDFACYGLNYIFDNNWIKKEEIGAIVVVGVSPDYFIPHISNIIHGNFDLSNDVLCIDLMQGCAGYIQGLMESFMLLDYLENKKIILVNGDITSRKIFKQDTSLYPISGDGATISIIEKDDNASDIYLELNYYGKKRDAFKIEAGGFRKPSDENTKIIKDMGGVMSAEDYFHMNGIEIFNFVLVEAAQMIARILSEKNLTVNDFDYFYLHQPNEYLLNELINKLGIPKEKAPINLVSIQGNTMSASLPILITLNHKVEMLNKKNKCFLAGYGSGLACGCAIMDIGKLDHIEEIISNL